MATTCLTNAFREGLLRGAYDFDSGIQDYYMALYNVSSHDHNTGAYTTVTEVVGTGYTALGLDMGDPAIAVDTTNDVAHLDWTTDPSWTSSTITATDCMIYRTGGTVPAANASVYIGDFSGSKSSSSGTFTVVLPAPAYNTSVVRLA